MVIKALSVRQPWADLIAQGKKTIETRTWSTKYRGPLVICSTKVGKVPGRTWIKVDLVDCRPIKPTKKEEKAACCPVYAGDFAWVLDNPRWVPCKPVRGRLGLFLVDL